MSMAMEISAETIRCRSLSFLRKTSTENGKITLPSTTSSAKILIAESIGSVVIDDQNPDTEVFIVPYTYDKKYQLLIQEAQSEAKNSPCFWRKAGCIIVNDNLEIILKSHNQPVIQGQNCKDLTVTPEDISRKLRSSEWLNFCQAIHDVESAIATGAREGLALGDKTWFLNTEPCDRCANALIAVKAREVYFTIGDSMERPYYNSEGLFRLLKNNTPTFYVIM